MLMLRRSVQPCLQALWKRWHAVPRELWLLYLATFLLLGAAAQVSTPYLEIARFARNWQFITLYGGFLVPLALLLRGMPWHQQYAYALMAIAPVEIGAFTLGTSLAYPNNVFDAWVGERNFTLAMVLIAAWIPYVANRVLGVGERLLGASATISLRAWGRTRVPE